MQNNNSNNITRNHLGTAPSDRRTLVIGANGKTGRRVAERLRTEGVPVVAASRSSEVGFDWERPETWAPALDGIEAAYITYFPDLAIPGADETVGEFVEVAIAHGVTRLVMLAGRGEEGAMRAERRLQESGADWTILRCDFFSQNFSETFPEPIVHGVLPLPVDDVVAPFLDADDIAEVAVASLLDDGHIGRLHELTGPRLVSMSEAAATLGDVIGRPVTFVPMSIEEYADDISQQGFPGEVAHHIAEVIALALDGRNASVTDGVERVMGRPATDFADYARTAAAAGAWTTPATAPAAG